MPVRASNGTHSLNNSWSCFAGSHIQIKMEMIRTCICDFNIHLMICYFTFRKNAIPVIKHPRNVPDAATWNTSFCPVICQKVSITIVLMNQWPVYCCLPKGGASFHIYPLRLRPLRLLEPRTNSSRMRWDWTAKILRTRRYKDLRTCTQAIAIVPILPENPDKTPH